MPSHLLRLDARTSIMRAVRGRALYLGLLGYTGLASLLAGCERQATMPDRPSGPVEVRTYREGDRLFVETRQGKQVARIGADVHWGGSIVAAELNGVNMVNNFDNMGRQIQISLYDGDHEYDNCAGCTDVWGWNPVQAGDRPGNPGKVSSAVLEADGIFVRVQPNQYVPENKGGGAGRPVNSDIIVEQRITAVPNHPLAFHLAYRIIHLGDDAHSASALQEFPAVYVTRDYDQFVHYGGHDPWTGASPSKAVLPQLFSNEIRRVYTSEWWGAFVNHAGTGITIFTPGAYPYMLPGYLPGPSGPLGSGTSYLYAFNPFGLSPHQEVSGDAYVILGDYREARRTIYDIRKTLLVRDISAPIGALEIPEQQLSGTTRISGWAFDNVGVAKVDILADDSLLGPATLGQLRPDLRATWPGAPVNSGLNFELDTKRLKNGPHTLRLRMADASGNVSEQSVVRKIVN